MNTMTTCWGCNFQPNYTMFYTILVLKIAYEKEIKVTKLIIVVSLEAVFYQLLCYDLPEELLYLSYKGISTLYVLYTYL